MTYKEVVPTNFHPNKSQRDILYALGDNLYTTQRVADRHESVGKAQIVNPKELQSKMKEYFGRQPKSLADYPTEKDKNYRIFSATAEGVKAADDYINSTVAERRASDALWLHNTAKLVNKVLDDPSRPYYNTTVKVCALQAAQNEVSDESKAESQHYIHVKNGKENAAKNHWKTASHDGPEL